MWKAFLRSDKTTVGSFSSGVDIHHMAVSRDFLFTASRLGIIEVWWKDRYTKITTIKFGSDSGSHSYTKITSLTTNDDGGLLLVGTSDGKIHVSKFRINFITMLISFYMITPIFFTPIFGLLNSGLGSGITSAYWSRYWRQDVQRTNLSGSRYWRHYKPC